MNNVNSLNVKMIGPTVHFGNMKYIGKKDTLFGSKYTYLGIIIHSGYKDTYLGI